MNRQPPKSDSATRHQHHNNRPSIAELKTAMVARWPEAFHDAGGVSPELLDGRGHTCPRCGGRDRFAAFKDVRERGSVQCRGCFNSGTDPRPGDGIATLQWLLGCGTATACRWLAGWLGWSDAIDRPEPPPIRVSVPLSRSCERVGRLDQFADRCHAAMKSSWWSRLERALSLPTAELIRLRVGWYADWKVTTWPMVDHHDNVVGIRTRDMKTGEKKSIPGGDNAVFMPTGLVAGMDRLLIAEGPTDTAALLSIGFDCIGRPSCNGAVAITTKIVKRLHPSEVVIVADDDANEAGKRGAQSLAVSLVTVCPRVRIIFPPAGINDARDWVSGGATADDVLPVVHAAGVQSLTFGKEAQQ